MAINLFANGPYAAVAKKTISFIDCGVTTLNMAIIYRVTGDLRSYMPGRGINPITGFQRGHGYYIIAKQDLDFSEYLIPPLLPDVVSGGFIMLCEFRVGDPGRPADGATEFIVPETIGVQKIAIFVDGSLISGLSLPDVFSYLFVSNLGRITTTRPVTDEMVFQIFEVQEIETPEI